MEKAAKANRQQRREFLWDVHQAALNISFVYQLLVMPMYLGFRTPERWNMSYVWIVCDLMSEFVRILGE